MADIDNSLILQDLRKESIIREMIEKTKNKGLIWTYLGGTRFQSNYTAGGVNWIYFVSKTQIGSLNYKYNFDIRRNGDVYITMSDGPLAGSARDSQTKDLYEIVEMATLQLDARAIAALRAIQNIAACSG